VVARLLERIEWARNDIGDALTESVGVNARPPGMVDEPWAVQLDSLRSPDGTR